MLPVGQYSKKIKLKNKIEAFSCRHYLRLDKYKADEPGKIIEEMIYKNEFDFENALTVLDKNGIRQRRY